MRKFLSVLLLIIFLLTFPLALFYFNAGRTILSPMYYKNAFDKINFYDRLMKIDPRVITDYLAEKEGGAQNPDSGLQSNEYISHVMSMISPEIVKITVENNINEIFNNVLDKGSKTMTVDLSLIKQGLATKTLSGPDSEFINQVKEKYVIPVPPELSSIASQVAKRKASAPIYLGITLLLLLLSAALWPNWKGKLRIPGIVLLILGLIIVPTSFLLKLLPMPGLGLVSIKELSGLIGDLYNNMKSQFYLLYLIEGGGIFVLGLIMIVVSAFLPGSPVKQEQVQIPVSPEQKDALPLNKTPEVPKAESTKVESKSEAKPEPKVEPKPEQKPEESTEKEKK